MPRSPKPWIAVAAVCLLAPSTDAGFHILVTPSLAPNQFGSPSYDPYRDNAIVALRAGLPAVGSPTSPTYYEAIAPGQSITTADIVVTDFPSWRGSANPTGAFASEVGNRLVFGLLIRPDATETRSFSISQLSFEGTTTDPDLILDFTFTTFQYSDDYVGLIFNPDGSVTEVRSGPNTQLVNALVGRGSGNAFEVLTTDPGGTNDEKIRNALGCVPSFSFTGRYTLDLSDTPAGEATVNVVGVPAPPTWVLMGIGVAGVFARAARRRARGARSRLAR
jgi:hypothetical protein